MNNTDKVYPQVDDVPDNIKKEWLNNVPQSTPQSMNLTNDDLQTILYSLEGYMQGNDDNELVKELDIICDKIEIQLRTKV